jgi:hypothetical protein
VAVVVSIEDFICRLIERLKNRNYVCVCFVGCDVENVEIKTWTRAASFVDFKEICES